jgi:hypothetical protein
MQIKVVSGASLAAAAIALAVSGAALTTQAQAKKAPVHCMGINACKGQGMCKSAKNACKGQNSCKGMGWLPEKSKAACTKAGGTVG